MALVDQAVKSPTELALAVSDLFNGPLVVRQGGFTLVELAIVMTIIGLLIGGILKGQELMQNARITATISEMQSYQSATNIFRDTYAYLPGDLPLAGARIPGCGTECNPLIGDGRTGDGYVGLPFWGTAGWNTQFTQILAVNADASAETMLFFWHLAKADLISRFSPRTNQPSPRWGITNPAAPINGGWVSGYADGSALPGAPAAASRIAGNVIALVLDANSSLTSGSGLGALSAKQAALIDRKSDDGFPISGHVQAFGVSASCFNSPGIISYNERTNGHPQQP
ncbi:prepilin-type N-terminal cleavage/methylation domain-containing protein [Sphingopyxis sp. FD7]|uniref:prepilin-type N-terminal cleavage/methylation domain-containing protein n=1 Tax=Sphingopyxis sp. FD7 TaxID=1914525 RepID=UPI000DC6404E|nr:prepilin-type N-terminal cleavage/methylation domain-containing protein [Sphingopyxis sp. FD7]BBB13916.1 prepilin-type N-terminal cleavage/methylation domain protein [Sphingopyxis sp. FD7]